MIIYIRCTAPKNIPKWLRRRRSRGGGGHRPVSYTHLQPAGCLVVVVRCQKIRTEICFGAVCTGEAEIADTVSYTHLYYKAAHLIDQSWSVRAAGLRQRHIDQAQSMNLYITNDYSMRQVLRLYLEAWRAGVKTIYYAVSYTHLDVYKRQRRDSAVG